MANRDWDVASECELLSALFTAAAGCLSAHPARNVHVHELPNSWWPGPAARLLQHHAGGHTICHYPGRHPDHLRPKVPAGVQELTHCPDTPLLPPSDSRGHNSSSSSTLQARVAEGAEGDR